jgi:transcriptional regulator of arginine metabolism
MNMQKTQRQSAILKLIFAKRIGSQDELANALRSRSFNVTQASVSRDLDELGIIKADGVYTLPKKPRNAIAFGLLSLESAGENLIVAKCESGLASAATVKIDAARIPEIVGTIAGDDTVFIAVKDAKEQKTVIRKVWEIFES